MCIAVTWVRVFILHDIFIYLHLLSYEAENIFQNFEYPENFEIALSSVL